MAATEELSGHADVVSAVEIAAGGDRLFTVSSGGTAIVWDVRADGGFGGPYPDLPGRWVAGRPEVVEPGRLVVVPTRPVSRTGGGDPIFLPPADTRTVSATFIDPRDGGVVGDVAVADMPAEPGLVTSVAVSPDRTRVAVTTGLVTTVLDTGTRKKVTRIELPATGEPGRDGRPLPAGVVSCAEWTPDGTRLLLCAWGSPFSGTGDLAVVDAATGEVERRVPVSGRARVSASSPDGRLLAVASEFMPRVTIIDALTLDPVDVVPLSGTDTVEDLAFSPDGRLLAVAGVQGFLQFVDVAEGEQAGDPARFAAPLLQAEWLADGETVVVAALNGTVSLFDVDRGLLRAPPLPASDEVAESHVHLLPGAAEELVAFSWELPGRRYPLEPAAWLAEACAIVARDLTPTEWDRYLPGRPYEPTCSDLR
ncbi:hypothetical protein SAMN05660209_02512 [Geodermatophilus africanus]|uniref:Uncharacterized protein n=1 Tax=Geodermatophilus africanus TaxID=1137993 RepID=A0A1H3ISY0_9ACTN|nr:hypothetical protein SAMN05660209_02512 [Geodermatophilus africanus]